MEITFSNQLDSEVSIYPINAAGRRGKPHRLAAQKEFTFETRVGSVFVTESHDGSHHAVHSSANLSGAITIKAKAD